MTNNRLTKKSLQAYSVVFELIITQGSGYIVMYKMQEKLFKFLSNIQNNY